MTSFGGFGILAALLLVGIPSVALLLVLLITTIVMLVKGSYGRGTLRFGKNVLIVCPITVLATPVAIQLLEPSIDVACFAGVLLLIGAALPFGLAGLLVHKSKVAERNIDEKK